VSDFPIRAWGRTSWSRRDYDARRPTGGSRYGVWHALQDSQPEDWRESYAARVALCGRMVEIHWWHDDPEPPGGYLLRAFCQRCLERSVEIER
jgi:hypothetical protein